MVFFLCPLIHDFKLNVKFLIAPLIPEISTDILVYEKGGLLKHINAPAIVKVELFDLWKKELLMMWNRIKYV